MDDSFLTLFDTPQKSKLQKLKARFTNYVRSLPGLVAYYPLDETAGNTALNQAPNTKGQYNGTITGATKGASGLIGKAYSFDGSGDNVSLGDIPIISDASQLSVVALIKTNNVTQDHYIFGNIGGAATGFFIYADDVGFETGRTNTYKIYTQVSGSTYIEGTSNLNQAGVWKMVGFTFKGSIANSGLKLYVNGLLDRSAGTSSNATVGNGNGSLTIGESPAGSLDANATIQHLIVTTSELSPDQMLRLAQLAGLAD